MDIGDQKWGTDVAQWATGEPEGPNGPDVDRVLAIVA